MTSPPYRHDVRVQDVLSEVKMSYQTLQSMLNQQLQELYAAESHVAREIRHYVDGAVSAEFKSQLMKRSEETERHVETLSALLQKRGLDAHEAKCRPMDALIKRGGEVLNSRGSDMLIDVGLVFTMRTIETLEQRAYEDAKTLAESLGEDEVLKVLDTHLREESQQECAWTVLADDMIDALVAAIAKTKRAAAGESRGFEQ